MEWVFNSFGNSVLAFENMYCKYIVLQVVEYEWEKSWISENVVIECILCESNEKWFTVWFTYSSVTDCVKSFDNVTSVLTNAC